MVLSVIEANVPPEKWDELKASFRHSTEILPPQICETLLLQSSENTWHWKVVTVWHVKQHIRRVQDTMRRCGAAEIFRAINIEPEQGLFNIVLKAREPDLGSDMAETPITDLLIAAEDVIEQL